MAEDKDGRSKAIDMALGQIEKQFGKGSIMKLGEGVGEAVPAIPTGSISIDAALGVGAMWVPSCTREEDGLSGATATACRSSRQIMAEGT